MAGAPRAPGLPLGVRHLLALLPMALLVLRLDDAGRGTTAGLVASAFLFVWLLTPLFARALRRRGAVVRPGGRSQHEGDVPGLGGVVVFAAIAAVLLTRLSEQPHLWGLLAGASLLLVVGVVDDVARVRPRTKILAQLAAGGCLLAAGFSLDSLSVPGLASLHLGWFSAPIVLAWIVLATNAFNLADGMDGQASVLALVTLSGLAVLDVHPVLALGTAAAVLGFLPHNLPRARIFLGDAGSLVLGFVLAALLLEVPARGNLVLAVGLFAYPLGDVAFSVLRRYVRAKPLFAADRSHVHHKLTTHLGNTTRALALVAAAAAAAAGLVLWRPDRHALEALFLLWVLGTLILVQVGRVRLARMLGSRRPFQHLHLLRQYATGLLRLARTPAEVERCLGLLARDLPLAEVEVGGVHLQTDACLDPACRIETLGLPTGPARYAYVVDETEEPALSVERRTIVADLLREADHQLAVLRPRERGPGIVPVRVGRPSQGAARAVRGG